MSIWFGSFNKKPEAKSEKKQDKQIDKKVDKKADKKDKGKKSEKKPEEKKTVVISPARLDLRVGKIVQVKLHPDADSLYVESIDLGEETGPRQIVSGLVKYVPLAEMQDRLVVCICNLKPAKMRGVESAGMVFCAEKDGACEPIAPPSNSKPGDKVWFKGAPEATPDAVLKSKEKVWETVQPKFKVNANLEGSFVDAGKECVLVTKDGACKVKNAGLVGGNMK